MLSSSQSMCPHQPAAFRSCFCGVQTTIITVTVSKTSVDEHGGSGDEKDTGDDYLPRGWRAPSVAFEHPSETTDIMRTLLRDAKSFRRILENSTQSPDQIQVHSRRRESSRRDLLEVCILLAFEFAHFFTLLSTCSMLLDGFCP